MSAVPERSYRLEILSEYDISYHMKQQKAFTLADHENARLKSSGLFIFPVAGEGCFQPSTAASIRVEASRIKHPGVWPYLLKQCVCVCDNWSRFTHRSEVFDRSSQVFSEKNELRVHKHLCVCCPLAVSPSEVRG